MARKNEILLDRVFDSVADPVAVYNPDLCIVRVNSAIAALFEMPSGSTDWPPLL